MSASNEWTEWHLTPEGWKRGTEKEDFRRVERQSPPNRVLSVRWSEHMGHHYGPMHSGHDELWRCENEELLRQLMEKFGEAPKTL